jgi:inorganic pyrophosphatase
MQDILTHVVTSGRFFLDIDAYGGIVGYAELLRLQGKHAIAASTAPFNASIPAPIRRWEVAFTAGYHSAPSDRFTVIDLSEPTAFETFVATDRLEALIDHHPGLEAYWHERLGTQAQIEVVGAACTLVFERWQHADLLKKMSVNSARLLACGILDNTLNFGAKITTLRDRHAYATLCELAHQDPHQFAQTYFQSCQAGILADMRDALVNDSKVIPYPGRNDEVHVGQLALWEASPVLDHMLGGVQNTLRSKAMPWYLNLISISEKKSYFISDDPELRSWLSHLLGVTFEGEIATANRMWLRKEIMKRAIKQKEGAL